MEMNSSLLTFTGYSIYCPRADVHIDPWRPVERAIITHAHSDHARMGSSHYLAHRHSEPILRLRLGDHISLRNVEYGEQFTINGVKFSLHPAGHIIGSAQVRVEQHGEVWVASGDYKMESDGFSTPFEPVPCNVFITESTFGLPVYNWKPQKEVFGDIKSWWHANAAEGKNTVLMGYSLGKMQRIMNCLLPYDTSVYCHGAVFNVNEKLRAAGCDLPYVPLVTAEAMKSGIKGSMIFAPPAADNSPWIKKFEPCETGYCSGWMAVRGARTRSSSDRGFVLSDHADWKGLNEAVKLTGAEKVYVTHGYTSVFSRWLSENGLQAAEVSTMYGREEEELGINTPTVPA